MLIPRVHILIAGGNSKSRFEPEYVLPVLRAIWRNAVTIEPMPESMDGLSIQLNGAPEGVPVTKEMRALYGITEQDALIPQTMLWVDSLESEKSRLLQTYGPAFNHVYPGEEFDRAFNRALKQLAKKQVDDEKPAEAPIELLDVSGMTEDVHQAFADAGFTKLDQFATATLADLNSVKGVSPGLAVAVLEMFGSKTAMEDEDDKA